LLTRQGGELVGLDDAELTLVVQGDESSEADALPTRVERITVIDETQFLRRLGLLEEDKGVSRLYTPGLLAKMVDVEPRVIRRWHRRGYLVAVSEVRKLPYFDFAELRVARRLADLVQSGASQASLDRQVAALTAALPDVARP